MLGSKTIDIYVGANCGEEMVYTVHQDVITLHSGYVRRLLLGLNGDEDNQVDIELNDINPQNFATFVCWMYYGTSLDTSELAEAKQTQNVWAMGYVLQAPSFQNYWMTFSILKDYKNYDSHFMEPKSVESVYQVTAKDSLLRKLIADIVNCENPYRKEDKEADALEDWDELCKSCPDFDADVKKPLDDKWKNARPWDEDHRKAYFEKEKPLQKAWQEQSLARRSRKDIKETADMGEVQSILEDVVTFRAGRKGRKGG